MAETVNDRAKTEGETRQTISPLLEEYMKSDRLEGKDAMIGATASAPQLPDLELAAGRAGSKAARRLAPGKAEVKNSQKTQASLAQPYELNDSEPYRPEPPRYQDPVQQLLGELVSVFAPRHSQRQTWQQQARPLAEGSAGSDGRPLELQPALDKVKTKSAKSDAHTGRKGKAAVQVEDDADESTNASEEKTKPAKKSEKAGRKEKGLTRIEVEPEQALDGMVGSEFWRQAPVATENGNKGCAIAVTKSLQAMGVHQVKTDLTVTGTANQMRKMGWKQVSVQEAMDSGELFVAVNKETESHIGLGKGNRVWENDSYSGKFATATMAESTLQFSGRAYIVPVVVREANRTRPNW
jgi:hypothetical protein